MNKRILTSILLLVFILSSLVSCVETGDDISREDSIEEESGSIDATEIKKQIDALYDAPIDREKGTVNLAEYMDYTPSYDSHDDYPDTGGMLTDGKYAPAAFGTEGGQGAWVGFNTALNGILEIELDLEQEESGIADLGISMCYDSKSGIGVPPKVEFYALKNDEYVLMGTVRSLGLSGTSGTYQAILRFQESITTNKIKIVCDKPMLSWLFVDEIFVYRYEGEKQVENAPSPSYYAKVELPEIKTPELWDTSEGDYDNTINLISGLPQQIKSAAKFDGELATDQYNSKETNKKLTDGVRETSTSYSGSGWFKFTRGLGREIYYDLTKTSGVTGYSFGFLKDGTAGVKLPNYVSVYASEDGEKWQRIALIDGFTSFEEREVVRVSGEFDNKYKARFIKINFAVNSHVYADEFEIFGTKNLDGAIEIVPEEDNDSSIYPNKYASPEDYNGMKDVFLSYICHENVDPITKEVYLPHVAYINDGEIEDTLFDTFMFLPYVAYLYEGGKKKPLKLEDWQYYIDVQFTPDRNMDALEAALSETKEALGNSDYKAGVFMSLLYPVHGVDFGVVNGERLDFNKVEDRKKALKWLIDEQLKDFEERNYENLFVQGFYWFTEEIDYSDAQLLELLKFTTDYVRSLGYITSWIPYYQASGYNEWDKLGFEIACYQPNYAFDFSVPESRLYDAAEDAKLLGMCIELEIGGISAGHVSRMKQYYAAGARTGFMTDAIHMYYQGNVPGSIYAAYNSTDPYINSLYHDTYKFIKGTFDPNPTFEGFDMECSVSGEAKGKIDPIEGEIVLGYSVHLAPKYGSVRVNKNGDVYYTPIKGVEGEDYFELVADLGYGFTKPVRIKVTIK